MIIFPLIFLLSFMYSMADIIKGNRQGVLLFFIFGLSIYTTTMSLSFVLGFKFLIPVFQPIKELLVLITLGIGIYQLKEKLKLNVVDYLMGAYFCYTLLYVVIPLGDYGFSDRLSAFKSTSFFPLIYAAGRFIDAGKVNVGRYFHYILLVAIAATAVLVYELISDLHFQTNTGYADYNFYYFGQEPTGNYGLTWTFETETGFRRFASFFSNPLEYAAATLLALAVIAGLYTDDENRLKISAFGQLALVSTFIAIVAALSRAPLASYFAMIYVYAFITRKSYMLKIFHYGFIAAVLYFIFLIQNEDIYSFVVDTITFQNASSVGHIVEWLAGIDAMIRQPLGLGLGSSGKVAGMLGVNVGGENQFIIIGVQAGVIALMLYLLIHIYLLTYTYKWIKILKGNERKIAIMLFLFKIGSVVPLLTTNFENYSYVIYISWFLSGIFIKSITTKSTSHD